MDRASSKTGRIGLCRNQVAGRRVACVALMLMSLLIRSAIAAPEDEVRATFDRFVAAQNAHDLKAVESLLLGSPSFLWITRGTPVWGPDAALKRFESLYEGTWRLDPEASGLKVMMIGDGAAQIYIPINFTIGAPDQTAATNAIPDEYGAGQDAGRLEDIKHPADTRAGAMVRRTAPNAVGQPGRERGCWALIGVLWR